LDTKNQFLPVTPKAEVISTSTKQPTVTIKKKIDVITDGYEINVTEDKLDEKTKTTDSIYNGMTNAYNDYTIPSITDNTIPGDINYEDQTAKIMYDDSPLTRTEEDPNIISYQNSEIYTTEDSAFKDATYLAPRNIKVKRGI
jgi:hypothetical protein